MNFYKLDFLQSIHGTVHDAFSYTIPMLYGKVHVYEKHDTRFSVHESIHWYELFFKCRHSLKLKKFDKTIVLSKEAGGFRFYFLKAY